jgi:hypothetical protein
VGTTVKPDTLKSYLGDCQTGHIEDFLGGHHSQTGRFKKLLFLRGIAPQILCCPSDIVVTTVNEIFCSGHLGISEKCDFYLKGLLKFLLRIYFQNLTTVQRKMHRNIRFKV